MTRNEPEIELQGQIERITYTDDESGYTIAKMKAKGHAGLVTVVGTLYSLSPGETLKVRGSWRNHPRYGTQLSIASYETLVPATERGIEKYLGSGMIKGIGPVTAKRLVAQFGTETLNVIEEDIGKLHEVPGIGEKRIEMIGNAWREQKDIRDVMVFLQV